MTYSISKPVIDKEEIDAVVAVMKSGMIAQGPKVAELEQKFAKFVGSQYAVAVNSGTAALHCALVAAGIGKGDEVITTPFSFVATVNTILMCGAKPVFVDIHPRTYVIDDRKLEKMITAKTKAILTVDLYGYPCNYNKIMKLAKEHNLVVIADACQAHGSEYHGKMVGNIADITCFSFYATKNMMCAEGGMITTNNPEYVEVCKAFRHHGMTKQYQYSGIGYNYRMTDINAAIAIEQLKKLPVFNVRRDSNAMDYYRYLKDNLNIMLPRYDNKNISCYHQFTIRLKRYDRDDFLKYMASNGVNCGVYYPEPLCYQDHIKSLVPFNHHFKVVRRVCSQVVSLPVHPGLTSIDIAQICKIINEYDP